VTASTATIPLTTSSVMLLPVADRISARFQPNVQGPAAGRAAAGFAHSAPAIAPTSDSMCPAPDSSASEPEANATMTSPSMKAPRRHEVMTR